MLKVNIRYFSWFERYFSGETKGNEYRRRSKLLVLKTETKISGF